MYQESDWPTLEVIILKPPGLSELNPPVGGVARLDEGVWLG